MRDIKPDLYQQIRSNKRKSNYILLGFVAIVIAFSLVTSYVLCKFTYVGSGLKSASENQRWSSIGLGSTTSFERLAIYIVVAFALDMVYSLFDATNNVVRMNHAKQVTNTAQYPVFSSIVSELCVAAGLPEQRFKLYIINDSGPNAFSVGTLRKTHGRFKGQAGIGVTTGMLKLADKYELTAVLGHEMSHIVDQDTRVETIGLSLTSIFASLGNLLTRLSWISSWFDDDSDDDSDNDDDNSSGTITVMLFLLGILGWLFSGVTYLTQLCLSRNREYLADAGSVDLTRDPQALISVFRKLEALASQSVQVTNSKKANSSCNALFMVNPHTHKESFIARMLDTHPPLEDRIKRLEEM